MKIDAFYTLKISNYSNKVFFVYAAWQLCYDENTGYNYYWNVETNEVKWEISGSDGLQIGCYNDQISNQSTYLFMCNESMMLFCER